MVPRHIQLAVRNDEELNKFLDVAPGLVGLQQSEKNRFSSQSFWQPVHTVAEGLRFQNSRSNVFPHHQQVQAADLHRPEPEPAVGRDTGEGHQRADPELFGLVEETFHRYHSYLRLDNAELDASSMTTSSRNNNPYRCMRPCLLLYPEVVDSMQVGSSSSSPTSGFGTREERDEAYKIPLISRI